MRRLHNILIFLAIVAAASISAAPKTKGTSRAKGSGRAAQPTETESAASWRVFAGAGAATPLGAFADHLKSGQSIKISFSKFFPNALQSNLTLEQAEFSKTTTVAINKLSDLAITSSAQLYKTFYPRLELNAGLGFGLSHWNNSVRSADPTKETTEYSEEGTDIQVSAFGGVSVLLPWDAKLEFNELYRQAFGGFGASYTVLTVGLSIKLKD